MRKRTNKIWNIPSDDLRDAVNNSSSLLQVIKHFELDDKGYVYRTLRKRLAEDNIATDFKVGLGSNAGRKFITNLSIDEVLKNGNRATIKRRLVRDGFVKDECFNCKQGNMWGGKPLTFQLDHINGIADDNRVENLQLLCPNCHSQTPTFAGKKLKKVNVLCKCGNKKAKLSKQCYLCSAKARRRFDENDLDLLRKIVKEYGYEECGRKYGVSGNAIRKRIAL